MDGPIVVGTDGSPTALKAVLAAAEMATAFSQPLYIVSAYHPKALTAEGLPAELAGTLTSHSEVDAVLADAASQAKVKGSKPEVRAVQGDAADALLEIATEVDASLLVVGNKGINSMRRFVLGNISNKVVHNSPCSTLVVQTT